MGRGKLLHQEPKAVRYAQATTSDSDTDELEQQLEALLVRLERKKERSARRQKIEEELASMAVGSR